MASSYRFATAREFCTVRGFSFAGVSAGLKPRKGVKDLGLLVAEKPVTAVGAFTRNVVQAAPVKIAKNRLKTGKAQAVLVNSGSANCFTGKPGEKLAVASCEFLAKELRCSPSLIIPCSTGVIGQPYDLQRFKRGVKQALAELRPEGAEDFAHAILTTDTHPKVSRTTVKIGATTITILGIAKGAGMISPAMATMLAFIVTDASVALPVLGRALKEALPKSFNALTVDGDMSTNDTVLLLASGLAGNTTLTTGTPQARKFEQAVAEVARDLAYQIAEDGEGATKVATVLVKGARTQVDADKIARQIANSPLVKTALFGCDPNVGRILAAAGASGVKFNPDRVELTIGEVKVAADGRIIERALARARKAMAAKEVKICLDLKDGKASASILTCDLSVDYVRINAEYTT